MAGSDLIYRDRAYLQQKYIAERLSTPQIALLHNVTANAINYWLRKHHIPVRSIREAGKFNTARSDTLMMQVSREKLKCLYWDENLSMDEIAGRLSVSVEMVEKAMNNYNIYGRREES